MDLTPPPRRVAPKAQLVTAYGSPPRRNFVVALAVFE